MVSVYTEKVQLMLTLFSKLEVDGSFFPDQGHGRKSL